VHRVIWKLHTGNEPGAHLDHIDGDKLNNRIENLREVSAEENARNKPKPKNNRSGFKGVCWEQGRGWKAYITAGGRQIKIGRFKRLEDAVAARHAAAERLHGEFRRDV
jgi:hypothetical protein